MYIYTCIHTYICIYILTYYWPMFLICTPFWGFKMFKMGTFARNGLISSKIIHQPEIRIRPSLFFLSFFCSKVSDENFKNRVQEIP